MDINMNDSRIVSLAQLKEFLKVSKKIKFIAVNKKQKRECPALGAPLSGYVVASALTLREAMDLAGRQNEVASVIES